MSKFYFSVLFFVIFSFTVNAEELTIYVSPTGNDNSKGIETGSPKKTIYSALKVIKESKSTNTGKARIVLLPGEHYLENTILINSEIGQLIIESHESGQAIIKGSKILEGTWQKYQGNIMQLKTSQDISPYSQLYVNGKEMILARYPNYDSAASHYYGYAADAIDPERIKHWKHPEGSILHAMHQGEWGGFHYVIEEVNNQGKVKLKGGHQNNRPSPMHPEYRMVENVFEELDAPGEWYFDKANSILYLYPSEDSNFSKAKIEFTALRHLFEIKGAKQNPVINITIKGIRFAHTNRTFMEEYEPLLRSDWMIYRGAAIYLENTEDCQIKDCLLSDLGGNAIFASGYNRNILIEGNHIYNCGANAISFVGLSSAVRSPSFNYHEYVPLEETDTVKGPKSNEYPSNCAVNNNLIHDIGKVEKQTAGVEISMAMNITVSQNSIYDLPRAGINVSEGTWGGHIIEYNDVFNTVLESSDHGAFNSWGRDRFWHPDRKTMDKIMADNPEMPYWDAINTTIIKNNRMRCDHGWDIDLDDGSSNYHLYNNLCLNGGIKLREGFYRTVENNIMVNNGFHPHVWFENSGDVFIKNIVMTEHMDIRLQSWGKEVDYNVFLNISSLEKAQKNGTDLHSIYGNPLFADPIHGDFTVSDNSPAFQIGFVNFPMYQFGVQKPELKKIAKTPEIPALIIQSGEDNAETTMEWLGATLKNIESLGEQSAAGLKDASGVMITSLLDKSLAATGGLQEGDVIIQCEENKIKTIHDLLNCYQGNNWKGILKLQIVRNQQEQETILKTK